MYVSKNLRIILVWPMVDFFVILVFTIEVFIWAC